MNLRQLSRNSLLLPALTLSAAFHLHAQIDFKSTVVKHLEKSRDFSLKVAEAMPESDYEFKLTPAQMSFAGQMTHLSQGLTYFLSGFEGKKPQPGKPKSMSKADIVSFMKQAYDDAITKVKGLTTEQISKTYSGGGESGTGADLLLGMLDHCTHHRASAEMYLRAKGITPPEYEF